VEGEKKIVTFFMEHMIIDLVEKTIERDQEARQVKEVKEKLFGRIWVQPWE